MAAQQQKKGETKNQHYAPQFYQRNFSLEKKNIGTYVINSDKYIPLAPIKNQSSGDYFYSDNMKIEHALGAIEALAKNVVDKIINNPKGILTKDERYTLYSFTMMQEGRTLARVNLVQEHANTMMRSLMKKQIELMRNNGKADEVEGLTDEILDNISLNFKQPGMLALGTQAQLVNTCIDLQYKVLINKTSHSFITSDNPAAIYDQFMERMGNQTYALGSRGLQIYFPLTPKLALMFYDPKCYKLGDRKKDYVEITQNKDIYELNKLTVSNAENVIYYKPETISEYNLKHLVTQVKNFRRLSRVEAFPELKSPKGNPIIGAHNISVFCKLILSFVKELPKYKALHMCDYDPCIHQFREIAYIKDDIIKATSSIATPRQ